MEWNDIENPPKEKGYILLSFDNYPVPGIGRYEDGCYYIGDDDETAHEHNIFVNGWMPLPKCKEY